MDSSCEHGYESPGLVNGADFFISEYLIASQRLCYMELAT
jgi:hypothetical protein